MKTELRTIIKDTVAIIESNVIATTTALNACVERIDALYQNERRVTHVVRSEHEAGEPYKGERSSYAKEVSENKPLEYVGKISTVPPNTYYENKPGLVYYSGEGKYDMPREILRVVPDEPAPKFNVGDWVVTPQANIGTMHFVNTNTGVLCIEIPRGDSKPIYRHYDPEELRPAVKSDFVFTVDGARMIVCEGEGRIFVNDGYKIGINVSRATDRLALACIREHNIIPCPVEVHQGDMTLPKEES
jgi:hypothetical protein